MIFARRQVNALRKRGIDNRTFFLSSRTSPLILLREWVRFRREIAAFDPHIVHAHFGTVTALFCALGTTRPLVVSFRGSDLNPSRNVTALRSFSARLFSQLAAIRAQHLICVSEQLKGRILVPIRPASIIFDGVDLSKFHPIPRDEARRQLGWSLEKKLVFFNLGGRPVGKRLDLAEAAVDIARQSIPEAELLPLTKVNPETIPLIMNACDCLLLTSEWEGSPTVVKEAIACNLPIVSVDVGDVASMIKGVQPSSIVPYDANAIGRSLVEILSSGARSNSAMHAHRVSEETTIDQILEIYESVLPGGRDARPLVGEKRRG